MRFLFPTGRGWLILFFHLICLALAFINQSIFTLVIAGLCLAILVASLVCAIFCLHGIEVRRGPARDAHAGEPTDLPLVLRNRCPWRSQSIVAFEELDCVPDKWLKQIVPPLAARKELRLERIFTPVRRGCFKLEKLFLRSGDPAGLFRREKLLRLPEELLVLPAITPLAELQLEATASTTALADRSSARVGTSLEFYGIREYRTTDGIRFINWRATARHRRLMVTEFEHNAHAAVALLVDAPKAFAGKGDFSNLERQICAAASLVVQCAERYCNLAFAAGGDQPRWLLPTPATDQQTKLMEMLARLQPGDSPLETALEQLFPRLEPHSLVICLGLHENLDLAIQLTGLAQAGMEVRWSYAAPQDFPGQLSWETWKTTRHHAEIPPGLLSPRRVLAQDPLEIGLVPS